MSAVILVEGVSDRAALHELARRRGRDLAAEGVEVVAIGGATNIRRALAEHGASAGVRIAGLCDAGEEAYFRRSLERAGLGSGLTRDGMEALGFFVCSADLEDELIRALGPPAVEAVIAAQGDEASLRIMQQQPAQRERPVEAQLRRFLGTRSGRKIEYARVLVAALDLQHVPAPLDGVLNAVR